MPQVLVGILCCAPFWRAGPLAEDVGASAQVGTANDIERERSFALIFRLAARFARGELEQDLACASHLDCDGGQIRDELGALRIFLDRDPRSALSSAIEQSRRCIAQGRIHTEVLESACEGALFSLGFFESREEDVVILAAFDGYLRERLSPDSRVALANAFYPRFNGLVWFAGRPAAAAWTAFIRKANAQLGLYTPEQLDVVLRALNDPPRRLSFSDFSYPPFSVQRRLRSLDGGADNDVN